MQHTEDIKELTKSIIAKDDEQSHVLQDILNACDRLPDPGSRIQMAINCIVQERSNQSLNPSRLGHYATVVLMESLVLGFPELRPSIPLFVCCAFKERAPVIKMAFESLKMAFGSDLGWEKDADLVTGIIRAMNRLSAKGANGVNYGLDTSLLNLLLDSIKHRYVQCSLISKESSSLFSSAMAEYVQVAAEFKKVNCDYRWRSIEKMASIAYCLSAYPSDVIELREKLVIEGTLEAQICDELFYKMCSQQSRSARLGMILGPKVLEQALRVHQFAL